MKTFVILSVVVAVAVAAPASGNRPLYELRRSKKSAYGAAPCGASVGGQLAPIALYLAPQGPPHYRENEHMVEAGSQEHPSARSYYDSGAPVAGLAPAAPSTAAASPAGLSLSPASSSGPAVGVFPNAKVGGCAVPLLLSCAPNVVSGHLVKQHSGYGYSAPSYKEAEEPHHHHTEMKNAMMGKWEDERSVLQSEGPHHHDVLHHDSQTLQDSTHTHELLHHHDVPNHHKQTRMMLL